MTKQINENMVNAAAAHHAKDAIARYKTNSLGLFGLAEEAFIAGAEWQADQVEPRDIMERELRNLGVDPDTVLKPVGRLVPRMPAADDAVMRMLGSIENRLMEMQGRERDVTDRVSRDLYHLTHRQESIDIQQREMLVDVGQKVEAVLDQVTPADKQDAATNAAQILDDAMHDRPGTFGGDFSRACREAYEKEGVVVGVDMAAPGSDRTAVGFYDGEQFHMLTPPPWAGNIVNVFEQANGQLIVSCERATFYRDGPHLRAMMFKS